MKAFIDEHRADYGVEPICRVLPIAPSTYYLHAALQANPTMAPPRVQRDAVMEKEVHRVWDKNHQVYGARKVWRQLHRDGHTVARCTVERLMQRLGIRGVVRGKPIKTTISDKAAPCPLDRVNRQFIADRPNALWVADFTYVSTWQGHLYVAFVIDVFARRIVGWKVSRTMRTDFVLDALEQALHARRPFDEGNLVHHSDRGSQYVSIRYSERLAEAGIEASVGSVGDSYDNALAETINGLYKAEVIHRQSWRTREAVEWATLEWVDWFNHQRLLEPIGNIPPAEAEANYYRQQEGRTWRPDSNEIASGIPGAVQSPYSSSAGSAGTATDLGRFHHDRGRRSFFGHTGGHRQRVRLGGALALAVAVDQVVAAIAHHQGELEQLFHDVHDAVVERRRLHSAGAIELLPGFGDR
jgi:transposase InsO family protein